MNINKVSRIHRALSNEKRLRIIRSLSNGKEQTTDYLARKLKLPYQTIARHIKILKSVGLVETRRDGLNQFYSLITKDSPQLWKILKTSLNIIKQK
jgi:DNA-binding transcriptional ArsR family regulator